MACASRRAREPTQHYLVFLAVPMRSPPAPARWAPGSPSSARLLARRRGGTGRHGITVRAAAPALLISVTDKHLLWLPSSPRVRPVTARGRRHAAPRAWSDAHRTSRRRRHRADADTRQVFRRVGRDVAASKSLPCAASASGGVAVRRRPLQHEPCRRMTRGTVARNHARGRYSPLTRSAPKPCSTVVFARHQAGVSSSSCSRHRRRRHPDRITSPPTNHRPPTNNPLLRLARPVAVYPGVAVHRIDDHRGTARASSPRRPAYVFFPCSSRATHHRAGVTSDCGAGLGQRCGSN